MNILVTGTAGFIGFYVAGELLRDGHTVIGVDNLNDYYSVELKRARNGLLKEYGSFVPAEIDLCDLPALEKLFEKYSPRIVCNLAAQAGVRYSLINPFAYQKSNLEAFLNILELCKKYKPERLVYASSSSVYAGVKEAPFSEKQRVDAPISLYAATKKSNELMAHTYSHLFNLKTVGLRFFTVYGPWGRPDMAMWLFTEAIMNGEPIEVYNHGKMKRDFTYVDDIASGVVASMFGMDLPLYSIFNLGNHRCEELMRMIEILENSLGKKAEKVMTDIQPGDVPETYADIDAAKEKLGFSPTTSIEDGIPKFVKWYLDNKDLTDAVRRSR
ncbi:MAG: NAD-dependent epimerase [bacterium]|nr:MAG: NAD-dependent epimerase [bacterium]